jgi:hypothetical protein
MQRTLRLGAPEVILGDFDGPKRVFFDAGLHGAYNSVWRLSVAIGGVRLKRHIENSNQLLD